MFTWFAKNECKRKTDGLEQQKRGLMGMVKIKILGISGSPRDEGTAYAVRKALEYAKEFDRDIETDFISLAGKKLNPCVHCDFCLDEEWKKKTGRLCPIKDYMDVVYKKIVEADGIIYGTPCYSGAVSAQLKALIDRLRPFFFMGENNPLSDKVFGAIVVGGSKYGSQELAIQELIHMNMELGLIPAPVMTFQIYHGGILWSNDRGKEGVMEDKEGLESVKAVGEFVVKYTKIIKLGLEAYKREQG